MHWLIEKQYSNQKLQDMMKKDKDWQTELMAQKLMNRFGKYDNFSMVYMGTHKKILCDV